MAFTKEQVSKIHDDINKSLMEVGKKWGISITLSGTMRFTDNEFTCKLTGVQSEQGVEDNLQVEKAHFRKYCAKWGLTPEDFGQKMVIQGSEMELIDIKPRATKNPFVCRSIKNGKKYAVPKELVLG